MKHIFYLLAFIVSGCSTLHQQKVSEKNFTICGNPDKMSAFSYVKHNKLEDLKNFLQEEADCKMNSIIDHQGNNLLHIAVKKDNPAIIHYLIETGIAINHQNNNGDTPLHWAIKYSKPNAVRILLQNKKIDTYIKNNKKYSIHKIITRKKINDSIIKIYIDIYWKSAISLIQRGKGEALVEKLRKGCYGERKMAFLERHNYLPKEYYQSSSKN